MSDFFARPFFTGINYWDSVHATRMWQEFDEDVIARDMKAMVAAGIDSLRVFPLWTDFQPLTGGNSANGVFEMQMNGAPLPDTEAGRAGVSEEMCRRFERFCALAEEHGLFLIVGLITGQMSFGGFYPPVFGGSKNAMSNPTMCKWALRYVRYFVGRMKKLPSIVAWDLGNEVENIADGVEPDAFYCWCTSIANAIRASDPTRPVVSGFGTGGLVSGLANAIEVGEYCDINTVQQNLAACRCDDTCNDFCKCGFTRTVRACDNHKSVINCKIYVFKNIFFTVVCYCITNISQF